MRVASYIISPPSFITPGKENSQLLRCPVCLLSMSVARLVPGIQDLEIKLHAREAVCSYRVSLRADEVIGQELRLPKPRVGGRQACSHPACPLGKTRDSLKSHLLPPHASQTLIMGVVIGGQ